MSAALFGYVSWRGFEFYLVTYCVLILIGVAFLFSSLIIVPFLAYRKSRRSVKYKEDDLT